jgi:phosphatidate cytidylyltransferase
MLTKRLLVVLVLIPVGSFMIALGGWPFTLFVTLALGIATWEYANIFKQGGFQPATWLMVAGVVAMTLWRHYAAKADMEMVLAGLLLLAMLVHLFSHERGRDQAATDFAITVSGILYLGVVGGYLVVLRDLPDGKYWFLLVLVAIALADTGAFAIGRRWGKHKIAPRSSPKKSWEGYIAGVVTAGLAGLLFGWLWQFATPDITPLKGVVISLVLGIICPMGDLGESMIKRQFNVKDSSNLLPGHGGVFDRIDSWLWAAVIGYYLVLWLK